MSLTSWVKLVSGRLTNGRRRRGRRTAVAGGSSAIECLEVRALLAAFVVDTIIDESDGNLSAGDLSLREAIESANALAGADTITFSPSVFGTAQTITLSEGEFQITDDVTVTGPGRDLLTLDGNDQSRIFRIDDGDDSHEITVEISALTVTNGFASDGVLTNSDDDSGGGIWTRESLRLNDVLLFENRAESFGGAVWSVGTDHFVNVAATENEALQQVGGFYNFAGDMTLERVLVHRNQGGGILNLANLLMLESTVSENNGSVGAGLRNADMGTMTIVDSAIIGNFGSDGGGIYNEAILNVQGSTIANNLARGLARGGGIQNRGRLIDGKLTLTNSTVVGNKARSGGGLSNEGGLFTTASVVINGSIIAGNTLLNFGGEDTGVPNDIDGSSAVSGRYNLIGDPASANGLNQGVNGNILGQSDNSGARELLDLSTVLGPLSDNGGPTQTMALLPGSPAIDAGDPSFDPHAFDPPITTDQRGSGFTRVTDGNGDGSSIVDIGAFESPAAPNVAIAESGGNTQVGESSNPDAFDVTLNQAPQQPVVVDISIGDPQIITLSATTLTFTPQNWNQPQTITVNGVNDDIAAGDLTTIVQFTINDNQSDDTFDGSINLLSVVMLDDDTIVAPEVTGPVGTSEDTRPTITWTAVEGAESYEVWLQLVGGDNNPILNPTVFGTSLVVPMDLVIGRYRTWVRATFSTERPSDWATDTFQIDAVPVIQALPTDNDVTPTITWSPVAGAISYRVYISNRTSAAIVVDQTVTETSFTPTAPLSFGQHQIWVRAISVGNYPAKWSNRSVYSVSPVPTAPVGALLASPSQFNWTAVSGAATHQIFVTGPGILINETGITGTTFTPATPLPDGDYRWWIRGIATDGSLGPWGDAAEFTTGGRTHISTPLTFNAAGIPDISWPSVPNAQEYDVYISKVGTPGAFSRTTVSPDAEYKAPALNNGDYRVWIRTTLADGSNVWGRGVAFTIDAPVSDTIAVPTSPTGGTFGGNTTFSWQATAGASSYDVYYLDNTPAPVGSEVHDGLLTAVVGTSTAVSELPAGDWSWWLRARDAGGVPGPWSLATNFNTSGRVIGVAASVTSSSIPTISWQPVAAAERYTLQVNNLTTGEQQVVRIDLVDSTYTAPTAFASGTYRIWVRAISNDATGPWTLQHDFIVA